MEQRVARLPRRAPRERRGRRAVPAGTAVERPGAARARALPPRWLSQRAGPRDRAAAPGAGRAGRGAGGAAARARRGSREPAREVHSPREGEGGGRIGRLADRGNHRTRRVREPRDAARGRVAAFAARGREIRRLDRGARRRGAGTLAAAVAGRRGFAAAHARGAVGACARAACDLGAAVGRGRGARGVRGDLGAVRGADAESRRPRRHRLRQGVLHGTGDHCAGALSRPREAAHAALSYGCADGAGAGRLECIAGRAEPAGRARDRAHRRPL